MGLCLDYGTQLTVMVRGHLVILTQNARKTLVCAFIHFKQADHVWKIGLSSKL